MRKVVQFSSTLILSGALVGCSNLPGSDKQQGTAIGGATGAAVGAAVAKENRVLGAIIGGAVGAAGGYVIGANSDKILGRDADSVEEANETSQESPVTPEAAKTATTADVNNNGFVTLDEVVAMEQAGLGDEEIISRLQATGQVFDLSAEQERYLLDRGVSQTVVDRLPKINPEKKDELLPPDDTVISNEPGRI